MTWVRLDDGFTSHPKVVGLSDAAFRGYVAGLCHCGRYLTDGVIVEKVVPTIAKPKVRQELVAAGLWEELPGRIVVHDFCVYNPTRAKVEAERTKTAERVRNYRARNGVGNGVTDDACNGVSNGAPDPTRPDPKKESQPNATSPVDDARDHITIKRSYNLAQGASA